MAKLCAIVSVILTLTLLCLTASSAHGREVYKTLARHQLRQRRLRMNKGVKSSKAPKYDRMLKDSSGEKSSKAPKSNRRLKNAKGEKSSKAPQPGPPNH